MHRLSNLAIAFGAWTLFSIFCASQMMWEMRTHGHSGPRMVLYACLVWNAWAAATPLIASLGRRVPLLPFSVTAALIHFAAALVLGTAHVAWWSLMGAWLRPFDAMGTSDFAASFFSKLENDLFLEALAYAAILGCTYAADYQRRLHQRERAALQLEASLAQARLHALALQLQPHFLFNTLHAIGGLVRQTRSAEAVEMIAGLSDLLRYTLDQEDTHLVPLRHELAMFRRYVEIQQIRFPDRLRVEVDVPDALLDERVPKMLLQPLAENAIRHGIEPSAAAGLVRLSVRRGPAGLQLELFNSGRLSPSAQTGVGLRNVRARLEQLFASAQTFVLGNEGEGVVARLTLP